MPGTAVPVLNTNSIPISTAAITVPTESPTLKLSTGTKSYLKFIYSHDTLTVFSSSLPDPTGRVTNIVAMQITNDPTHLIVSWQPPTVTNDVLTGHQVVVTVITNGNVMAVYSQTVSGSQFNVTITGLRKCSKSHESVI